MEAMDDLALLREYASRDSQAAFTALVSRRVGFVYSSALRQLRDPHLAEDVAQTVFVILARKARQIPPNTVLTGWLFRTTRFAALAALRAAAKRRRHEEEARMEIYPEDPPPAPLWQRLAPLLDESLETLGERDRQAVLLRYFENQSLAQVGRALGASEEAARKRVNRALEKLHRYLGRRGIACDTAAIASAISLHSAEAIPASLAASVSTAALAQGACLAVSNSILVKGALNLMAYSKLQSATVAVAVLGVVTFSVVQHRQLDRLHQENQSLQQRLKTLEADNDRLSRLLARSGATPMAQPRPDNEVLRLRAEVGRLRQETNSMSARLAQAGRPRTVDPEPFTPLPQDYPVTPEDATKAIVGALSQNDLNTFVTRFGEPGVPRELYDQIFGDPNCSNMLAGLDVVSVGTPTNSFATNMWFVPCLIRFRDGSEHPTRLHIAQHPTSLRWYFKGGL